MADLITTIVNTPYLLLPIVIWLWQMAKLPKVEWSRVGAGVLLVLSAHFLGMVSAFFQPFPGWGSGLSAFFGFFATVANVLGLAMIGLYLLIDALLMWKV